MTGSQHYVERMNPTRSASPARRFPRLRSPVVTGISCRGVPATVGLVVLSFLIVSLAPAAASAAQSPSQQQAGPRIPADLKRLIRTKYRIENAAGFVKVHDEGSKCTWRSNGPFQEMTCIPTPYVSDTRFEFAQQGLPQDGLPVSARCFGVSIESCYAQVAGTLSRNATQTVPGTPARACQYETPLSTPLTVAGVPGKRPRLDWNDVGGFGISVKTTDKERCGEGLADPFALAKVDEAVSSQPARISKRKLLGKRASVSFQGSEAYSSSGTESTSNGTVEWSLTLTLVRVK